MILKRKSESTDSDEIIKILKRSINPDISKIDEIKDYENDRLSPQIVQNENEPKSQADAVATSNENNREDKKKAKNCNNDEIAFDTSKIYRIDSSYSIITHREVIEERILEEPDDDEDYDENEITSDYDSDATWVINCD